MLFSSLVFLFGFLPIVLVLYFVMPRSLRNIVLLLASLWFYAWGEPSLVVLMLVSTAMNYVFALGIESARSSKTAKGLLALAVIFNLSFLIYYKYAAFLVQSLNRLLALIGTTPLDIPEITLPIGISFYTFQAMSYVIDVYRGQAPAERSLINVALYIALFPQLIAGPIVRYVDVAARIKNRSVNLECFGSGVQRFIIGLGKKVLIANSAATVADAVFTIPESHLSFAVAWLGIICYTLQIYFDFSGYSDMAIGLGRMFGFHFLENFNYPYVAKSVTEFWRRWHISLSSWFRDYLYIPLGGSRCSAWRVSMNLLIVFLLCGLWHGASMNFAIWGLYHGSFLMLERSRFGNVLARLWTPLRHAYVMLTVMGGWVLFRVTSLAHGLVYFKAMAGWGASANSQHDIKLYWDSDLWLVLLVGILGSIPWLPWVMERSLKRQEIHQGNAIVLRSICLGGEAVRLGTLFAVLIASSAALAAGTHNPFIYFRF